MRRYSRTVNGNDIFICKNNNDLEWSNSCSLVSLDVAPGGTKSINIYTTPLEQIDDLIIAAKSEEYFYHALPLYSRHKKLFVHHEIINRKDFPQLDKPVYEYTNPEVEKVAVELHKQLIFALLKTNKTLRLHFSFHNNFIREIDKILDEYNIKSNLSLELFPQTKLPKSKPNMFDKLIKKYI